MTKYCLINQEELLRLIRYIERFPIELSSPSTTELFKTQTMGELRRAFNNPIDLEQPLELIKKHMEKITIPPQALKDFAIKYKLTQTKIADLTCSQLATVKQWYQGGRNMPLAKWELLNMKVKQNS